MATPPVFSAGAVLTAAQMNAVGLWLVKTQTVGSAVSSVTVSDVFSSDYDNYRVVLASIDGSVSDQISLLTFGSTTTGYYGALSLVSLTAGTQTILTRSNAASNYLVASDVDKTTYASFDIYSPYLSERTGFAGTGFGYAYTSTFGGFVANTTSYTAFTITAGAGTMTGGTISVYGYRK